MQTTGLRRVVLVGGGHSHIQVLDAFANAPLPGAHLTLVVDRPIAVYSGMVPGFVAGQYRTEELQIDPAPLAKKAGVELIEQGAVSVDARARTIALEDGHSVAYDIAAFDIGSTVRGLDLPGVTAYALPTRPIGLFVERVREVIESARRHPAGKPFHVLVVGGGAGGVELAFTFDSRLKRDTSADVRVTLLDGGSRVLTGYSNSLKRRVERRAAQRGIEIRCNQRVASVEPDSVQISGSSPIPYDTLVWVTGAVSHPVFGASGLPTDERGFVRIRPTLQLDGHDDLFATGDCGTLIDYPKTAKAGVYAVRQGPYLTDNLRAALAGEPLKEYVPQSDFLALLNLGDGTALGTKWGRTVEGRWVMKLKDRIDRKFMNRFPSPTPRTTPQRTAPGSR